MASESPPLNMEATQDSMLQAPRWKARVLALYLPQFHPIPENDRWWGPGFTEWRNVARARPLFRGHRQPHLPGELGFYDLRLPETRRAQAALAKEHGVEAFAYWHYWFEGRRLLERPFREVIESGDPECPFCIAWANHSWTGVWIGLDDRVLVEQTYPGKGDVDAHFEALLPALRDKRYFRVDGCPVMVVFRPRDIPDPKHYWGYWRELASKAGLPDLHLIGIGSPGEEPVRYGMDGLVPNWVPERKRWSRFRGGVARFVPRLRERLMTPTVYPYEWYLEQSISATVGRHIGGWEYGALMPNWDNTPRSGRSGVVLQGSSPSLFGRQVRGVVEVLERNQVPQEHRVVVLKSWNEWAEGNYVEPDVDFERGWLTALRDALLDSRVQ